MIKKIRKEAIPVESGSGTLYQRPSLWDEVICDKLNEVIDHINCCDDVDTENKSSAVERLKTMYSDWIYNHDRKIPRAIIVNKKVYEEYKRYTKMYIYYGDDVPLCFKGAAVYINPDDDADIKFI